MGLFNSILRVSSAVTNALLGNVILTAINILAVPFYLAAWGSDRYGDWLAVTSMAGLIMLLDGGLGLANVNHLTAAYARDEMDECRQVFATTLSLMVGFAIVVTFLGLLTELMTWTVHLLGIRSMAVPVAASVVFWALLQTAWTIPLNLLLNVRRTLGNVNVSLWQGHTFRIILACSTLFAAVKGMAIDQIAKMQCCIVMVAIVVSSLDALRLSPYRRLRVTDFNLRALSPIAAPSVYYAMIVVTYALNHQLPTLMVSRYLGGAEVAIWSTTRTMANALRMLTAALANGSAPEFTALISTGRLNLAGVLLRLVTGTAAGLLSAVAVVLWHGGGDIIGAWTGGRLVVDGPLIRAMSLHLLLQAVWLTTATVTASMNEAKELGRGHVFAAVIASCGIFFSIPRFGLIAIPVCLLLGEMLFCYVPVIRPVALLLGEDLATMLRWLFAAPAASFACAFLPIVICYEWIPGSLLLKVTVALVVGSFIAIPIALAVSLGFQQSAQLVLQGRQWWIQRIVPPLTFFGITFGLAM